MRFAALTAALLILCAPPVLGNTLTLRATGESLATEGFQDPFLTRDGWALDFDHVIATFDDVAAWRTDPPFMADGSVIEGEPTAFTGPLTLDLRAADADGYVTFGTVAAQAGHYNALSFALVPAPAGSEHAGYSLVLVGTASRDGRAVPFTLRSADRVAHACGEYVGDMRKGFVTDTQSAEVEITLHLDHVFGRADLPADDAMNLGALGFDRFASGGVHDFSLNGLHLGHVGEGHCHVAGD